MPRDSMTDLINRLREMIGDNAADPSCWAFSDDALQLYLDANRRYASQAMLCPVEERVAGGARRWLTWTADYGDWETDTTFVDDTFAAISPTSSDPQSGRWTFATHQEQVYVTGKHYDLFGAAADALEAWAARGASEYDFAPGQGESFKRSQTPQARLQMAQQYRTRQWPTHVTLSRSDTAI